MYAMRGDRADASVAPLVAEALEALLGIAEADLEIRELRHYDLGSAFAFLEQHRDAVGPERVARLEWQYLPALGFEPNIPSLHRALVEQPSFFVEVLSAIYRRHSGPATEPTPEQEALGSNAYRLLSSWEMPPGMRHDGTLDAQALRAWVDAVVPMLDDADRRGVGEIHIGHVLAFAPSDGDGGWPCVEVRDLLEDLQSDEIERGLETQIFNNRGITSRSPGEGGTQERGLAERYSRLAGRFSDRWPRTASILRSLAKTYEQDARREDDDADRFKEGL